jgi:hypothetical protein
MKAQTVSGDGAHGYPSLAQSFRTSAVIPIFLASIKILGRVESISSVRTHPIRASYTRLDAFSVI